MRTADGEVRFYMRAASKSNINDDKAVRGHRVLCNHVSAQRRLTIKYSCLLIPMQTTSFKPLGMPWMKYSCMDGELDSVKLPSDR